MTGQPANWIRSRGATTELRVLVVPRASRTEVSGLQGDRLKVRLAAPPVEGKANKELVRFFAKLLGVSTSSVSIERGETGRRKLLRVEDPDTAGIKATVEREIGEAS